MKAQGSRSRSKRAWTGSGVGSAGRETNEAPRGVSPGTGVPTLRCTVTGRSTTDHCKETIDGKDKGRCKLMEKRSTRDKRVSL